MADRGLNKRMGERNRFRSRSIGAAASALAAGGAAAPASATVIYDFEISHSPNFNFDLTGDITGEFELFSVVVGMMGEIDLGLDSPAGGGMMAPSSTVEFSVFDDGMGRMDFLTLFDVGDTVDGSLDYSGVGLLVDGGVANTDWTAGEIGYAGFSFDAGGGTLYGWLRVRFEDNGTDFTVLGWAYEDEVGTDIIVPEPGLALLLGLGIAGVAASWKRRPTSDPPPSA